VIDSTILATDTLKSSLRGLVGFDNKEFRLLHRGTRDGFTDAAYHSKVDGGQQVIVVLKTDVGHVLGAYIERQHRNSKNISCNKIFKYFQSDKSNIL